ncbi:MAG TPA: alpha/beta hydrolase [Polyangiales bacterium]|nr:alpha/beta hydrolase [Polyangiales bacterium]
MATSSAETKLATVGSVRVAYEEQGSGPLVLSAHGLTSSRAAVAKLALADFSPVSRAFRLVSYDARGHGDSTGTTQPSDYAWPALSHDMLALADLLSPNAAISCIGLSMGTGTLLHAALRAPQRFDRLVLTAPPTAWETRAAQTQFYERIATFAEQNTPEQLRELFRRSPAAPVFHDVPTHPVDPDIPHAFVPAVFRGAGLSDLPAPEALSTLNHRTLILAWDTDAGHPVSTAQRLHALLKHSELHISKTSADIRSWGERTLEFLSS